MIKLGSLQSNMIVENKKGKKRQTDRLMDRMRSVTFGKLS
jgi:hypothetical protein